MIIRGRRYRLTRFTLHMMRTAFEWTRPAIPDNLYTQIGPDDLAATFVGHATLLLQWKGLNILTDPNFAPRVIIPKRLVEPGIPIHLLPPLDLIVVSHAHFDHLVKPSLRPFDDLRARYMVPMHWGTFRLSYEPIHEPPAWLARLSANNGYDGRVKILQHG